MLLPEESNSGRHTISVLLGRMSEAGIGFVQERCITATGLP